MKLALGTAQFGLSYGIANQTGQLSSEAGAAVLSAARSRGVDTVDTAIAYGTSEAALGRHGMAGLRVVTKLPVMPDDENGAGEPNAWVHGHITASLERLGLTRVYGLLLHAPAQLLGPVGQALYDALQQTKRAGLVEKIGVSVYTPSDLTAIWPRFAIDLVQAPLNVLDRRLVSSGTLASLTAAGVECHARSAFLQGLLVMSPEQRPARFDTWQATLADYDAWVGVSGLTRTAACLRFVLGQPGVDRVVVGIDSVAQAHELLDIAEGPTAVLAPDFEKIDPDLLNPSRWPRA